MEHLVSTGNALITIEEVLRVDIWSILRLQAQQTSLPRQIAIRKEEEREGGGAEREKERKIGHIEAQYQRERKRKSQERGKQIPEISIRCTTYRPARCPYHRFPDRSQLRLWPFVITWGSAVMKGATATGCLGLGRPHFDRPLTRSALRWRTCRDALADTIVRQDAILRTKWLSPMMVICKTDVNQHYKFMLQTR